MDDVEGGPQIANLLVVEDTQFFRQLVKGYLEAAGYEVVTAVHGVDGLARLDEQEFDLTPDGSAVVTGWRVTEEGSQFRDEVVVIDASTGQRRSLLSEPGFDFNSPRISPRWMASRISVAV